MSLAPYRKSRFLSQEAVAVAIGLSPTSKSYISELETGARHATISVALRIEALSDGVVPADSLLSPADADLLANHRRLSAQPGRNPEPEACPA